MSYIIDQRKILFWKKASTCDNVGKAHWLGSAN